MSMRLCAASAAVAGATAMAQAQPIMWAATSGAWSAASNWNPMDVPDMPGEHAVLGGSGPYAVDLDLSPTIGSLVLLNPAASLFVGAGRTLTLTEDSENQGAVVFNSEGLPAGAILLVSGGSVLLDGAGEFRLRAGGTQSVIDTVWPATMTNGAAHTIRGVGTLQPEMENAGAIVADSSIALSGTDLLLTTGPVGNSGVMSALPGSTLRFQSVWVTQSATGRLIADGGHIAFSASKLRDGVIEATGSGSWSAHGQVGFWDVTSHAPGTVEPGGTLQLEGNRLNHTSVIRVNPMGSATNARIIAYGNCTIGGLGEIHLCSIGDNAQILTNGQLVLTHGAEHVIRGAGQIHANIVNYGSIIVDPSVVVTGQAIMELDTHAKRNRGFIEVRPGAILAVRDITIDQAGGGVLHLAGGTMTLSGSNIAGGKITATEGGSWTALANMFDFDLFAVTNYAPGRVNHGCLVSVIEGLVNHAPITLNPAGSDVNAVFQIDSSGTIEGSGRLELRGGGDNAQINVSPGFTATQAAGHAITGDGQVNVAAGGTLVNRGLLSPGPANGGIGTIECSGTIVHAAEGVIHAEISRGGQADILSGSADHALGGTLELDLIAGRVPERPYTVRIVSGNSVTGSFVHVVKPFLPPGLSLKLVYGPDAVDVTLHCTPDVTTVSVAGQPGFGVPNGVVDNDDFFYYLTLFSAGDPDADLTATAVVGQPGYGRPDGLISNEDFFFFLAWFAEPCGTD